MTNPFNLDATFEDLQAIKRQEIRNIDSNLDYRETSLLYNSTVVNTVEMIQMLMTIKYGIDLTFADTAPREYLIRRAAERGISPEPATKSTRKGTFNIDVPIGSRFSYGEINFKVIQRESLGNFVLECEENGTVGNVSGGTLVPIEFINGLTSAVLGDIIIPGEDEEDTETFRNRYLASFESVAFGGNRADYKQKVNAIAGVGGTRVYRAWNGGGTVKLVIIDSTYSAPSSGLIEQVQTIVDPTVNSGEGLGLAPIDHIVTVFGVTDELVNITLNITYQSGYTFPDIESSVKAIIDEYFKELSKQWAESQDDDQTLVVRISQIESRLLNVDGVLDIQNTLINGLASNLQLGLEKIPKRGVISG